jgi:hypothetical protein
MATYKVIQDIEAEDKFIGPLTLKQFVFAGIAAVSCYLSFLALTKHFNFILFFTGPIIVFTGFLAWPWSRDQPTEVWALAKLRFMFKPRRRIWNQTGMQEPVTITAPKRPEVQRTNGLTDTEVKSRLRALANTIDSRGWAIKNVNVNLYAPPSKISTDENADRLLGVDAIIPEQVPTIDIRADEDMLDPQNNPTAQHLDQLMSKFDQSHRQAIMTKVRKIGKKGGDTEDIQPNYWFMHQNAASSNPKGGTTFDDPSLVTPVDSSGSASQATSDDAQVLNNAKGYGVEPLPIRTNLAGQNPANQGATTSTAQSNPAILNLATNDDLNVATIARQAEKDQRGKQQLGDDEVVVSLR